MKKFQETATYRNILPILKQHNPRNIWFLFQFQAYLSLATDIRHLFLFAYVLPAASYFSFIFTASNGNSQQTALEQTLLPGNENTLKETLRNIRQQAASFSRNTKQ